jgi:dihydropteroate synthase
MADRAMRFSGDLRWDRFRLDFSGRTLVMGVLNVTPDSFSDGGSFFSVEPAVVRAMQLVEEGADIIDVGGESTRPGSSPVPPAEQIRRVIPVIERIAREINVPVSIDTMSAQVAEAALTAGARIVNDLSALRFDPPMAGVAAKAGVPVILAHMQGSPATMQESPYYENAVGEVKAFLRERMEAAVEAGIDRERIILDVGIGFGKRLEDNLALISRIEEFLDLGRPILVGHSRKGFIGKIINLPVTRRDEATLVISTFLAERGVHMLRVHDVGPTRQACEIVRYLRSAPS